MTEKLTGDARSAALAKLEGWRELDDRDAITKALGVTPVRLVSTSTCTNLFSRWAAVLTPIRGVAARL